MTLLLKKKMHDIGLSEKETDVYLALLEMGSASAQDLSIKSATNRATTYAMLEALRTRGLVGTVERGGVTIFIADDPFQLMRSLHAEGAALEKKLETARGVIPHLQSLFDMSRERNNVRVFEGAESIRVIQNEIVRSAERRFYTITNITLALRHWPRSADDHREAVYKKGFRGHVIFVYDASEPIPAMPAFADEHERRYLPMAKFPIEGELSLYNGDTAAFVTLQDTPTAVTITNKTHHDLLMHCFNSLWDAAKLYSIDIR